MQERLVTQAGLYTTEDIIVAVIAVLLVLEVGRRAVGEDSSLESELRFFCTAILEIWYRD